MRTSVRIALGAAVLAVVATATYFHFTTPTVTEARPPAASGTALPQPAPK